MLTAQDIMSKKVITVPPEMPVETLASVLYENKIGGAPVVDVDNKLLGVVTESDLIDQAKNVHIPTVVSILDSFLFLESTKKMDKEIEKMTGRTVVDICSKTLVTVEENTSISQIATIMAEKRLHTVPVMRDGELVGVRAWLGQMGGRRAQPGEHVGSRPKPSCCGHRAVSATSGGARADRCVGSGAVVGVDTEPGGDGHADSLGAAGAGA